MIQIKYLLLMLLLIMTHKAHAGEEQKEKQKETVQGEASIFDHTEAPCYNPEATFYIRPHDLKYNLIGYRPIDRSIKKIDQFSFTEYHHNKIQNLGSNGSAAQSIFYILPKQIGISSGFHAYDIYFSDLPKTKYYYTPSHYSYFNLIFARLFNFHFDACYSKNIMKNWNIGIYFQSFMSGNEWPKVDEDDKVVSSYPHIHIFTHFKTSNTRYHLFTSFADAKHKIKETGGITRIDTDKNEKLIKNFDDLLNGEEMGNNLSKNNTLQNMEKQDTLVLNKDKRKQIHLYHQFICIPQLHLYHEMIWKKQANIFQVIEQEKGIWSKNEASRKPLEFLGMESITQEDIDPEIQYKQDIKHIRNMNRLGNEIGVKGNLQQLFYALYYRREHVNFLYTNLQKETDTELQEKKYVENYAGLNLRYSVEQNKGAFYSSMETLPQKKCYKIKVGYRGKGTALSYKQICYQPSFLVQEYYNSKFQRAWKNKFKLPQAKECKWQLYIPFPYIYVAPGLSFTNINHLIFFKENPVYKRNILKNNCITEPVQAAQSINILSLYTDIYLTFFSYFHADLYAMFTIGDSFFTFFLPKELYNGRIYYAAKLYRNKLDIEIGCNIHFKTKYLGDFYDVVIQQFYKQNRYEHVCLVHGEPIIDIFVNFRIKNFKAFWRIANIGEFFKPKNKEGYYVTPFYPGQRQSFDIGVCWSFFD